MNDVSQDTYDKVKYPWQSQLVEAIRERNPDKLGEKITAAKDAVAKREGELTGTANLDERVALDDARHVLATLIRQSSD